MRALAIAAVLLVACGHPIARVGDAGSRDAQSSIDAPASIDASGSDAQSIDASASDAPAITLDAPPAITADALRAALGSCARIGGDYGADSGDPETIPVCGLDGIVWFDADLDVDCDGGREAACLADPYYLPDTSGTTSTGEPLDASTLPFIVLPIGSTRFRYADHDIRIGQVAMVLYGDRIEYGIFGDAGPSDAIGEASYAMAESLGIDPDPVSGGADSGATYIVFTGAAARVAHNESHDEAVALGEPLARALLAR